MNAVEIINNSQISQLNISDDDKSLDGSKTFGDIKAAIAQVIEKIDAMLPRMKAAGTDMQKASDEVDGLFRNMLRKAWGSNEVSFYTTRNGSKAIVGLTPRNLDDITEQIGKFVANY